MMRMIVPFLMIFISGSLMICRGGSWPSRSVSVQYCLFDLSQPLKKDTEKGNTEMLWHAGRIMAVWDAFQSLRWHHWVCEKTLFFSPRWLHKFRGGSAGWISTYVLKKLEHKYSVQHFCTEPFAFLWLWNLHSFYFRILKINIFIFGCTGSSLLHSLSPAVCTGFSPR